MCEEEESWERSKRGNHTQDGVRRDRVREREREEISQRREAEGPVRTLLCCLHALHFIADRSTSAHSALFLFLSHNNLLASLL